MVIVITLILGVTLFLRWGPFERIKLDSTVRKLAGDIRYTQKLAISTQARAGIIFETNGYSVYANINGVPPTLANSPGEPCSTDPVGKFIVDFTAGRCKEFEGITLSFINNTFAFSPIGSLVNSTSGEDLNTQSISVNYKDTKTITIEEGTGRVSY